MKKEKIKNILLIVIVALVTSFVTAYGVSSTFDSSNVCYKVDSSTGASVQDTIDDLYGRASDYSNMNTRLSNLEGYFDQNSNWININDTNIGSGVRLLYNNTSRGSFYYNSNNDITYLSANNSTGTGGQGTLNLIGNPVMINGENLAAVKYKDYVFNNVSVEQLSGRGAYYTGTALTLSGITSSNIIIGIVLKNWNGAKASFVPYLMTSSTINIMSDVSQVINEIQIRVVYI